MHKARLCLPPLEPVNIASSALTNPTLRFVLLHSSQVLIRGDYVSEIKRIYPKDIPANWVVIPVLDLQLRNVLDRFPQAQLVDFQLQASPQASTRSVIPAGTPDRVLKLALGVKISSALRTVTEWTCFQGPGFSKLFERLVVSPVLGICQELGSIIVRHGDTDVSKHLSCIIRDASVVPNEKVIICAALMETCPNTNKSFIQLGLGIGDDEAGKLAFIDRYGHFIRKGRGMPSREGLDMWICYSKPFFLVL